MENRNFKSEGPMLVRISVVRNEIGNYIVVTAPTKRSAVPRKETAIRTTCWRINFNRPVKKEVRR